jgi:hypothetical protein
MSRTLSASLKRVLGSQEQDEALICFLTITHALLSDPVRVCSDTVDYVWNGATFIGFPFDLQILSDNDEPPTAKLSIQNVDRRIGEAVQLLDSPARLRIDVLAASWFNASATPRVALGDTPFADYTADKLFLTNVKADALAVSADIVSWNYTQEIWPGIRATQDRLPGLFR